MSPAPIDAAELTRRLTRRPAGVEDDHRDRFRPRHPFAAQAASAFAAVAVAGGGGGGGGQHGGDLVHIGSAVQNGQYPYWFDDFDDATITGWTQRLGTWAESGGTLTMTVPGGLGTFRGFVTFDDSAGVADIETFVTLAGGTVDNSWIGARLNASATPVGYGVRYNAGTVSLCRMTGVGSVVLASDSFALSTGDKIGLRCRGTELAATVNGLTVLTATDATHASGLLGLAAQASALPSYDDWGTR